MDRDFALGLVGLVLASAYLYGSSFIVATAFGDPVGAAGLPRILGWLLVAVSLVIIAQSLTGRVLGRPGHASEGGDPGIFDVDALRAWGRGSGVVALAITFIVSLPHLGYPIAAGLLILAMSMYYGMTWTWRLPVVAIAGAFVMWALFGLLFRIRLPMGLLEPFVG